MLLDLYLRDKRVVVFGAGRVGERKVRKLIEAQATVTVASFNFSRRLKVLSRKGNVKLVRLHPAGEIARARRLISEADFVIVSTDNREVNRNLTSECKVRSKPVCVADDPEKNDFSFPAIARVGPVRVAISTEGKSPAVARSLRQRIEHLITKQDLLQIQLQSYARKLAKKQIPQASSRRRVLQKIATDIKIRNLLSKNRILEARQLARCYVQQPKRKRSTA